MKIEKIKKLETSLEKFNRLGGNDEYCPVERLRLFCSLAMTSQDLLDSEKFFKDILELYNR